jgi:hypothetical protein
MADPLSPPDEAFTNAGRASVDTPNDDWRDMEARWELIERLCEGTQAMRDAREELLPMESGEERKDYENRLSRSFLYDGLKSAVRNLSSKPFEESVKVEGGELPEMLQPIEQNADRCGTDLTQFAKAVFTDALKHGHTHIMVDYPRGRPGLNLAAARAEDIRPYFRIVCARSLFGWRLAWDETYKKIPLQIRYRETLQIPAGDFGSYAKESITVWTPSSYQIWLQEKAGGKFMPMGEPVPHTFPGIPIVSIYFDDEHGYFTSTPPLWSLAECNLAHWQSSSDQRNALRFARMAILHQTGVSPDETKKQLKIGPTAVVRSTNPQAGLAFVEHSGASMKIGQDDLDLLEERMDQLAGQPLMVRPTGSTTATEKAIDEGKAAATIIAWVRAVELGLREAYRLAAQWTGETLPNDFAVNIYDDFALSFKASEDMQTLHTMRAGRDLSQKTYLSEIKRRGVLSNKVNVEDEMRAIQEEGPAIPPTPTQPEPEGAASAQGAEQSAEPEGEGQRVGFAAEG